MDSSEKVFCVCAGLAASLFIAGMLTSSYSSMLQHSCRLHAIQATYDSAHIAQICGK